MPTGGGLALQTGQVGDSQFGMQLGDDANAAKRRRRSGGAGRMSIVCEEDEGFVFTRRKRRSSGQRMQPEGESRGGCSFIDFASTPKVSRLGDVHGVPQPNREQAHSPEPANFGISTASMEHNDKQIPLPLSDTPVIRKNQRLRQSRRSSLGMRGKRASSIGNGFSAVPHPEIDVRDYVKHISNELPNPQRMKQLLAWCGRKALEEQKQSGRVNGTAGLDSAGAIARIIEEELLADLIDNRISTSWYHRGDHDDVAVSLKPNPQNVTNLDKLKDSQAILQRLLEEEELWKDQIKRSQEQLAMQDMPPDLDVTLLDAEEQAMLEQLAPNTEPQFHEWIKTKEQTLESNIDSLFQVLHEIDVFGDASAAYGAEMLARAARLFDRRLQLVQSEAQSEDVSPFDLLRAISRR